MKIFKNIFNKIISLDNLFLVWAEFCKNKQKKPDVQKFEYFLEQNIFVLYRQLSGLNYQHDSYKRFHIYDPKYRIIHKATVKDRLVHHLVFKELCQVFEPIFIHHSYSSRIGKGVHLALNNLAISLSRVSRNYTQNAFILKCDIKQFFHSVSHQKLFAIIKQKVKDEKFLWLIKEIISSFNSTGDNFLQRELNGITGIKNRIGIPIGNVTSQIFANIYLNEFDWFIKKELKIKHYFRYADDFVIIHHNPAYLEEIIYQIKNFLTVQLALELHSQKIQIRKFRQGIDFLGYVILPHYLLLRTRAERRIFIKIKKRIKEFKTGIISQQTLEQSLQSYLGVLSHGNCHQLSEELKNKFWFWLNG